MRVVLSGLYFPMAILRYFEAALMRRDDVELYTVGPYSGTFIPWNGGMHLPSRYAKSPDIAYLLNGNIQQIPIGFVEKQLPWQPDLWLQIDAGFHFIGKPQHGKNVIVGTDPHVLNYNRQRQLADTFYCMQACYARPTDEYLPYAYCPDAHHPEKQPQNYDVCLIGLHYETRNQLIDALKSHNVKCYYDLGPSFDEARALYNQAQIGLNWSSLDDLTARVFELLGMRRLAVVNHVPDLERFFRPNIDLIAFRTLDEAIERILYYRDNPAFGQKIANIGHESVKMHTWDERIKMILEAV